MGDELKHEFISATLRFKKVDICGMAQGDIHVGELVVMGKVMGCDCGTQCLNITDIQESLHVSRPAISQILNSLERKGYIVRQIGPDDRRKIAVQATDEGRQALAHAQDCYDSVLDEFFVRFGFDEMMALVRQMHRLADIYEQMRQEKGGTV